MKFILSILACLILASCVRGGEISLAWDPNPEPGITYRVEYAKLLAPDVWTAAPLTDNTEIDITLPYGKYIFRAFALVKDNQTLISQPSSLLYADVVPVAPGGLKKKVKVITQSSGDLIAWYDVSVIEREMADGEKSFYRTTIQIVDSVN